VHSKQCTSISSLHTLPVRWKLSWMRNRSACIFTDNICVSHYVFFGSTFLHRYTSRGYHLTHVSTTITRPVIHLHTYHHTVFGNLLYYCFSQRRTTPQMTRFSLVGKSQWPYKTALNKLPAIGPRKFHI
jgi:hypothetical protein